MSAELLREAAELMRKRAETALDTEGHDRWYLPGEFTGLTAGAIRPEDDEYLVSLHPTVAIAVADLLDVIERDVGTSSLAYHAAADVARAYLGRTDG